MEAKEITGLNLKIKEAWILPIDSISTVYDIITKEEHTVLNGQVINAVKNGDTLFVSKELYEKIKLT